MPNGVLIRKLKFDGTVRRTWEADLVDGDGPAPPGWVVKTNRSPAAGLTRMLLETTPVRLPLLKTIVIVSALLCDRLLNVTTPLAEVTLVVPCNVAVPRPRAALTTVVLSAPPLAVLRVFPNWSCTSKTGAGEKTAPAVTAAGSTV